MKLINTDKMYKIVRPILFAQDSEKIHDQIKLLGCFLSGTVWQKLVGRIYNFDDPNLEVNFLDIKFKNPVGLAAGFDKNGELLDFLPALGFGFLEIGSVTAQAREGNPKPRLFRLIEDQALINRMGLNNLGADAVCKKLKDKKFTIPIGINIAKTHDPNILGDRAVKDFIYSFKKLYGLGNYIVLNISCPNTVEGKTFEEKKPLTELLSEVRKIVPPPPLLPPPPWLAIGETGQGGGIKEGGLYKPILVKISPDVSLGQFDDVLEVCEEYKISGYIIGNASSDRVNLRTSAQLLAEIGQGGLSGKPIRQKSTQLIKHAYRRLRRPCIIGLGGIDSPEDAYEKIKAGASLVQIYTGLIYRGPGLVKKINQGLVQLLRKDGFTNISEAVGKDIEV